MNGYYGQNQGYNNRQGFYTNTYSLWHNSQYYDINNLNLRNHTSSEWKDTENVARETSSTCSDRQSRTVINRESIFKDSRSLGNEDHERQAFGEPLQNSPPSGHPQQNWVKAGNSSQGSEQNTNVYTRETSCNKIERILNNALKNPAKMTKAESMMQKMGWQGGALGKTGDGILEPITPNAVYATKTAGLGHVYQQDRQNKQEQSKQEQNKKVQSKQEQNKKPNKKVDIRHEQFERMASERKKLFYRNTLRSILMFVRNDSEVVMEFDETLLKRERKKIHDLVNEVISSESPEDEMETDNVTLYLLRQIKHYNCYVLSTQSQGEFPNRQLSIYKEAPAHVFLIIPDDLWDDEAEDDKPEVDIDESNPFLKSITKNIREENDEAEKEYRKCLNKIIAYFEEFQRSNEFTELRFLGSFSSDGIEAINKFFDDLKSCIDNCYTGVSDDLVKVFQDSSSSFQIIKDVNGSAVVHKLKKEQNIT